MKFDWTINVWNLLPAGTLIVVALKAYGDWRVWRGRLLMMWKDYCLDHNIDYITQEKL